MANLAFQADRALDFIAIGRLCIDLNANEINRPMEETMTFTKYVGGSPANITIGMSRYGMKSGFIGKVADDQMGRFIVDYLRRNHINTNNVVTDRTGARTGLAFTEIKSPTDCSILLYRDQAADLKLEAEEVREEYVASAKMLLISGTALAASPSREAVFLAMDYARKHDVRIIFDIDYREASWTSLAETAIYYNLAAERCDVIIGTREEFDKMEMFEGGHSNDEHTASKWFNYAAKLVIIKHGKDGSIAYTKDGASHRGSIFPARVIKTFGAGDAYASGFLYGLMSGMDIPEAMSFGGAAASIVISSHSCSDAMPTVEQVRSYMEQCRRGEIISS